jgi:hypothetical protein
MRQLDPAMVGALGSHGYHALGACHSLGQFPQHVVGVSEGKVDVDLGQIWAELGLGPKTKVEAHEHLYTFHLKHKVISVLD